MKINPLVSVIVASYNYSQYLEQCLDSIFNQTYDNLEIVIFDDCSTDDSRNIINHYEIKYNFKKIFNDVNKGPTVSVNIALNFCTGKYLVLMASDDFCEINRIADMVNYFETLSFDVGFIATDYRIISPEGNCIDRESSKRGIIVSESKNLVVDFLDGKLEIATPTIMYKTACIKQIGGYDETMIQEDLDMIFRLLNEYKVAYLDKVLVNYRLTPNSLSRSINSTRIAEAHIIFWKKYYASVTRDLKYIIENRMFNDIFLIYQLKGDVNLALEGIELVKSGRNLIKFRVLKYYLKLRLPSKFVRLGFQPFATLQLLLKNKS